MKIEIPSHLSDAELIDQVKHLARSERQTTAHLVAHLAEMDARRLHRAAGFPSLFAYCREVLELSEQSTYNRIEAARVARRFPAILDMLSEAAVSLATVRLLAPHLNPDNHEELLQAASHKSKREVEELLARYFPQPDVPASLQKVRALPPPPPASPPQAGEPQLATPRSAGSPIMETLAAPPARSATMMSVPTPAPRQAVRPLAQDRYEVRFTASASTCEKLRLAQDLLRHAVPTGDMAGVVDRALTALLEDLARRRFAATDHPRASGGARAGSRHIPADVRRKVWLRDQGRCSFTSTAGRRCGTRGFLEFHHVQPFAAGGQATPDNIQLRCRAHNDYEAELYFGPRGNEVNDEFGQEAALTHPAPTHGSVFDDPQLAPGQVGAMP